MASNWLPREMADQVREVARVFLIDRSMAGGWNAVRGEDEIRLFCGWAWSAKDGSAQRQGYRTQAACLRDAYYELVRSGARPVYRRYRGKITIAHLGNGAAA